MDISRYPKVKGKRFDQWPKWEGRGIPTRENCDLDNPRQAFLWMFTAPPGQNGAPLAMPTEYYEMQSYHMWVLGARPQRRPELKYQPPQNVYANRWNAAGEWVSLDTPDQPRPSMADIVSKLPQQDRADLKQLINDKLGVEGPGDPDAPVGWLRVEGVASRLGVDVETVRTLLSEFGMETNAFDLVSQDIASRIAAHLGLEE